MADVTLAPIVEEEEDDDFGFDFVKSFEELTMKCLEKAEYDKAETYMRKAHEKANQRLNASREDQRSFDFRFAATCCMQDKWDEAETILTRYRRPLELGDLPAMGFLREIARGISESGKTENAFRLCKSAVQGYTKFLTTTDCKDEYDETLFLLASLYRQTGQIAESEAIMHSLPAHYSNLIIVGGKAFSQSYLNGQVAASRSKARDLSGKQNSAESNLPQWVILLCSLPLE